MGWGRTVTSALYFLYLSGQYMVVSWFTIEGLEDYLEDNLSKRKLDIAFYLVLEQLILFLLASLAFSGQIK